MDTVADQAVGIVPIQRQEKITTVKELQRSNLEVPANIAASFITPMAVDSMLGKTQGAAQAQEQQVTAQQVQRALMNNDPNLLAGAYMPYTNFQAQGGPSGSAMMRQLANDMGTKSTKQIKTEQVMAKHRKKWASKRNAKSK